jgi:tetratricopeptide (TPR) repeat protein
VQVAANFYSPVQVAARERDEGCGTLPTRGRYSLVVGIKEGLRLVVARTCKREASDLVPFCNDQAPAEPGLWTVKDTLAHLTAWRVHATAVLYAARTTTKGPEPVDDINQENAGIYAAARELPAAAVIEAARRSWDSLAAAIEGCTEDVLRQPRPGRPQTLTWEAVPGNTHAHLAEHLGYLAEERGDAAGAEAAARWAHDLDNEAFPEPRQRGNADYNLGCYFARRGQAGQALPLLRRGFALNPSLKDWARKDADLDPLRATSELATLLR